MVELESLNHHIQRHILSVLLKTHYARFSELRPPRTDTNLFSYHLKLLVKQKYVVKTDKAYTLGPLGMSYVDRVNAETVTVRQQPKIISMLLVQNSNGDILVQKRTKQPYIDTWTLPYGKVHIDDASVEQAAKREAEEKLGLRNQVVNHAGDCYIHVYGEDGIISTTLAHVFTFNRDDIEVSDTIQWARPHKLQSLELSPAVEKIVARTFFHDPFFFEEFDVQLV